MLKQAREVQTGTAWLVSDKFRKALEVRALSTTPSPGSLSFFAPDFSLLAQEPWLLGRETEFREPPRLPLPHLVSKAEPSSADFARTFEDISARIRAGEFEKVVPMVCEEYEFAGPLARAMFSAEIHGGRFSYGFEFGEEGMAGHTPELLFTVEGGVLKTMALAGTAPAGGPSLLDDPKEMHEHRLVIEHISSELARFGQASVGATVERVYGALKHLYTPLEFKLSRPARFEELVTHLHPTAALGGWPRKPAVEWLEKQPFHAGRGRFGAPFGYVDGEDMTCVVAIRNVQWKANRLQVSSGCGVVGESQVLKEWKELELKRQSIFRALGVEL
jgi:menaquinone-specific isochorismate synthase